MGLSVIGDSTGEQPIAGTGQHTWRVWAVACLPLLSLLITFLGWRLPDEREALVSLTGEWRSLSVSGEADALVGQNVDTGAGGWQPLNLPGSSTHQAGASNRYVVRRTFTVPAALSQTNAVFILGAIRSATARVFVNGTMVGHRGVPSTGFNLPADQSVFLIEKGVLTEGENVIALDLISHSELFGIVDTRLLLGPESVLVPWASRVTALRSMQELGGVLLLMSLVMLVGVLWWLQRVRSSLYLGTIGLVSFTALYLALKSALLGSAFSPELTASLVAMAVYGIGVFIAEYYESYYLGRKTLLRRLNRWVGGALLLVAVPLRAVAPDFEGKLYLAYCAILICVIAHSLWLALRAIVLRQTRLGPLSAVASALAAVASVAELLGDLGIWYGPKFLTQSLINIAVASAATVIGEFMQMASENRRLSGSLTVKNLELAEALSKAEESARLKTEFLANTSHELRTPLNSIINIPLGLLELMHGARVARCASCQGRFELESGDDIDAATPCPECGQAALTLGWAPSGDFASERTEKLLGSVVASGKHLLAVVNDILDYSKIDAGRMTLFSESVDVTTLLQTLRDNTEPLALRANVTLDLKPFDPGTRVEVDEVKIMQALINLVANAIKFSDGRGTVTVETSLRAEKLAISVTDQGLGIAPQNQQLIFSGFRQVETGTTRRFGGTGLGLAISQKLARLHGGEISVRSELGKGSQFTLELPLVAGTTRVASPELRAESVIVVVDDEATAVDATIAALAPLRCQVIGLSDPRSVIQSLRDHPPVLIVLDVMMPWVSGLEVMQLLQAEPTLAKVPVLVSSAYPENRAAVEALGARFVAKPWRPGELLRLARELVPDP